MDTQMRAYLLLVCCLFVALFAPSCAAICWPIVSPSPPGFVGNRSVTHCVSYVTVAEVIADKLNSDALLDRLYRTRMAESVEVTLVFGKLAAFPYCRKDIAVQGFDTEQEDVLFGIRAELELEPFKTVSDGTHSCAFCCLFVAF
jgi:hypothetical protein